MNKKQKILAIFTLSLVLFLLLGNTGKIYAADSTTPAASSDSSNPLLATADVAAGVLTSPITLSVMVISYIAGVLASIAVQIGGFLSNFSLSLNFAVLQNPLIDVGWKITRDLANLGFVLFIIIIAIATILRFQEYGAKSTLGKLIAVALLVNFSLVFAGVFIDFSNMLTNFFISNITGAGVGGLGTSLAAAFNVGQFMGIKNFGDALKIFTFSGALKILAGLVFAVVFTLLVALCLIAVAAMFILRYLNLSVLLVLAPLACLFIILPATESMWKEWWKNFTKWIIFAPVASFFFYLAVYLANNYKTFTGGISLDAQGVGKMNDLMGFGGTPMLDMAGSVINLVIVGGFLMFGLIISNKLGIGGAKTFLNVASWAGKKVQGGIKGLPGLAARTGAGQKLTEGMQNAGLARGRLARTISAPIRGFGNIMAKEGTGRSAQAIAKTRKDLEGLTNDQKALRARGAMGPAAQAAFIEDAAKEGYLDKLPAHLQGENAINILKRAGRDPKALTSIMPHWDPEVRKQLNAGNPGLAQTEIQKKLEALAPKKWANLQIGAMLKDTQIKDLVGQSFLEAAKDTPDALGHAYESLKPTDRQTFHNEIKTFIDTQKLPTQTREDWLMAHSPALHKWFTSYAGQRLGISL